MAERDQRDDAFEVMQRVLDAVGPVRPGDMLNACSMILQITLGMSDWDVDDVVDNVARDVKEGARKVKNSGMFKVKDVKRADGSTVRVIGNDPDEIGSINSDNIDAVAASPRPSSGPIKLPKGYHVAPGHGDA